MKKLLALTVAALSAISASAQILISDFSSLGGAEFSEGLISWSSGGVNQFAISDGILTIAPVGSGNPDAMGYFAYADLAAGTAPMFDATDLTYLSVLARADAGNQAAGYVVSLFDDVGNAALSGTFSLAAIGWNTATTTLIAHSEGGDITRISYFGISGIGTADAFRASFDSITLASAIPEPSTYAAIFGGLALGFVAYRRRAMSKA
jgi:hypothetical protein